MLYRIAFSRNTRCINDQKTLGWKKRGRFVLIGLWVVCVFNRVHAADLDEKTPLLVPSAVCGHTAISLWEQKIDQVLQEKEKAWVVSLPEKGGQYGMMCDLQQETLVVKSHNKGHKYKTIEPCINLLGDQFLQGWHVNPGQTPPQMEVDCGIRDLDLRHCTHDRFLSGGLSWFLCRYLGILEEKGKISFDGIAQPFTKDLRQVIPPRFHRLRWVISSKKDLLDAVQEETRDAISIFVVVGGHGVLKGEMERSKLFFPKDTALPQSCLLSYKMDAVWHDWLEKYPFSQEAYQHCLNYKKKFGRKK